MFIFYLFYFLNINSQYIKVQCTYTTVIQDSVHLHNCYTRSSALTQLLYKIQCTYTTVIQDPVHLHNCYTRSSALTQLLYKIQCTYTTVIQDPVHLHNCYTRDIYVLNIWIFTHCQLCRVINLVSCGMDLVWFPPDGPLWIDACKNTQCDIVIWICNGTICTFFGFWVANYLSIMYNILCILFGFEWQIGYL